MHLVGSIIRIYVTLFPTSNVFDFYSIIIIIIIISNGVDSPFCKTLKKTSRTH